MPRFFGGLSTRDLVTIAILSGMGGILSTYIGYLANLVNSFVGTPFGAGQFLAGLHLFWILLARAVTAKTGSGTLTGALKGVVEMLVGSVHGFVIVVVSLVEGIIVDALMVGSRPDDRLRLMIVGGFSSASNVLVFQMLFLSGVPLYFILAITLMAFASGVLFGGHFSHSVLMSLIHSGVLTFRRTRRVSKLTAVAGYLLVGIFMAGSIWYYASVYSWNREAGFEVKGLVEGPYRFDEDRFRDELVTVEAELQGSYLHVGPRNYTGVPLADVVRAASPSENASRIKLVAKDGYAVTLELSRVRGDRTIIVVTEDDESRLVADNLDGSMWIRDISYLELT